MWQRLIPVRGQVQSRVSEIPYQFEPGKEYLVVCGDQVLRWNGSSLKGETPEGIAGINTSLITLPDTLTGEEGNTYLWCMQKAYNGDGEQQYRMYNVSAEKQEKRYWNLTNGDGKKLYAVDENNDGNYNKLSFVKNNDGSFNVVTNKENSEVAAVWEGSTASGASVVSWANVGSLDQMWIPVAKDNKTYVMKNLNSEKSLAAAENGTITQKDADDADAAQLWTMEAVEGEEGFYALKNVKTGQYLSITGNGTALGLSAIFQN